MAETEARRVRVAVVQDAPVMFDRDATLERVDALTREAAGRGAQLVLFPEAFVSGYPQNMTFGAVVGTRTRDGHERYRRYWASAVEIPGPALARLGGIAAEHAVHLVIGVIERDGGTLYSTALFLGPDARPKGCMVCEPSGAAGLAGDAPVVDAVVDASFPTDPPARTVVGVAELPAGARVKIAAIVALEA